MIVSILILLDYLFLSLSSYWFWTISSCFNPYFTGLPILIRRKTYKERKFFLRVSILILLDYLFLYQYYDEITKHIQQGFNPYFTGLPILIRRNKIYNGDPLRVSILILLDYLFLFGRIGLILDLPDCFNPYFTGLPILIIILDQH